jgi:spermidine/putrescine ABC transporter ATP-binding subunit
MPAIAKPLTIAGLNKSYRTGRGRSVPVVQDFNLELAPGEFVTLLGPSGCGKTTVLRTLAGLEEFEDGDIRIDGRSIAQLPPHHRHIGLVFQNYALFPHMSVADNVAYSLRLRRAPESEARSEVAAALSAVGLDDYGSRLPGQLSGGQQQRVAVARALVMKPDLLLFDEPLSNLDAKLRVQVRAELRRLQRQLGTTSLFVTHDQEEAMSLSDRVAVMRAGKIEQIGPPEAIYARPATLFVAEFVGKVNAFPGRVVASAEGGVTVDVLGHPVKVPGTTPSSADVLVMVRPEAVRLGAPVEGGMVAEVAEIEYLGHLTEYRLRMGDTLVVAVASTLGEATRIAEGDRIGLEFAPSALYLLKADGSGPA